MNGVRFDAIDRADLLLSIARKTGNSDPSIIRFCATHPVVLARSDPEYRDLLNRGELTIPDGIGPALAVKMLGGPYRRIPGVEAMQDALRAGSRRHFFFGSTPETLQAISRRLVEEQGESALAGVDAPPFRPLTDAEWAAVASRVRASRADVLWVGLGVPKQDFAAEKLCAFNAAPVICCVGAAFDFYAGSKRRAPRILRMLGLEWTYRLLQEPTRLWRRYLVGNAVFVFDFCLERLSPRRVSTISGDRTR